LLAIPLLLGAVGIKLLVHFSAGHERIQAAYDRARWRFLAPAFSEHKKGGLLLAATDQSLYHFCVGTCDLAPHPRLVRRILSWRNSS
jgi:hypothetical protein